MSYLLIIPARYQSKRFPGKPLKKIYGKEMISYVWEKCISAVPKENVLIATDSNKIQSFCKNKMYNVALTSSKCLTGTDRIYEISKKIKRDFYINVQGDEPLIDKKDIERFLSYAKKNKSSVINAYTKIKDKKEYFSANVPKVIFDKNKNMIYMSRSNIPGNKKNIFKFAYKQVCIYSFPYKELQKFGKKNTKSLIENIEDIEILRFLEMGIKIKMFETKKSTIGVDTKHDLKKVERIIKNNAKIRSK